MEVQIRKVRAEDARGIINILNPIIKTGVYTVFTKPLSEYEERDFILNFPQRGIFNVALGDSEVIVGFQDIMPFETFTGAFDHVGVIATYVDLRYHRQGIAKRLFETSFREAREKDYEKIFTYIRADNEKGLAAYFSEGFEVIGIAKKHAKVNRIYIDEIFIEKFL